MKSCCFTSICSTATCYGTRAPVLQTKPIGSWCSRRCFCALHTLRYIAIFSAILAISRTFIPPPEEAVFNPVGCMRKVRPCCVPHSAHLAVSPPLMRIVTRGCAGNPGRSWHTPTTCPTAGADAPTRTTCATSSCRCISSKLCCFCKRLWALSQRPSSSSSRCHAYVMNDPVGGGGPCRLFRLLTHTHLTHTTPHLCYPSPVSKGDSAVHRAHLGG